MVEHLPCKFWLEDFSCLFKQINFIPDKNQNEQERLNSMTWVIIIVSLILLGFGIKSWWIFLLFGLSLIIIIFLSYRQTIKEISHYTCQYKYKKESVKTSKFNLRGRYI
jgi:hypothetical protein